MAFTRKGVAAVLKNEGLEDDQKLEELVRMHTEVVTGLKDERDQYKEGAEGASALKKELEDLKAASEGEDPYKQRYEDERKAFEEYKAGVEAEKADAAVKALYREQLEALGIGAQRVKAIMKVADMDALRAYEVEGGAYKQPEAVREAIKAEWADFIPTTSTKGANVPHPPKDGHGTAVTAEQFKKMDIHQRQELFAKDREAYNALAKAND